MGSIEYDQDRSAWFKSVTWSPFLRVARGISKLPSFFYDWTTDFPTSSFFSLSLPVVWGWQAAWGKMVTATLSVHMCRSVTHEVFCSSGINMQNLCFPLELTVTLLNPSGATEYVSKAVRTHKRPSAEKIFEWSHYSPNWSWVVHGLLKRTVKYSILCARVPYQSHLG